MRKFVEPDVADNPLYHDTWKLLKKYRDVVWSLELSVQHVRTKFEIEYGTSIEDFLDSVYLAGADLAGSDIEHHGTQPQNAQAAGFRNRIAAYQAQKR